MKPKVFLFSSFFYLGSVLLSFSKTLYFAGHQWDVRQGQGAPGPNNWDERNAWLDESGQLHIKLAFRERKWTGAEIWTQDRLGFGTYQIKLIGRPDQLDPNIVFGFFGYTTPDIGPDTTNEIDIEFSQWGRTLANNAYWTVWPAQQGIERTAYGYPIHLSGTYTTHRYIWQSKQVEFQALNGHQDGNANLFSNWTYHPTDYLKRVPQKALPFHINIWLFNGKAPINGQEVEMVISEFKFTPFK
ncbi:MAG: glycoside hydrolase family 16 protein [Verrucomicrobiota bacterium]